MTTKTHWIWRHPAWPAMSYDARLVAADLAAAHRALGLLEGRAAAMGLEGEGRMAVDVLVDEATATAAIEGERLPLEVVRSSVMRRLGHAVPDAGNRSVDGLVEVVNDASTAWNMPLDADRLCRWQSALFPGGTAGIRRIAVGRYRDHADAMQIVSGLPGREVVHYEAPGSQDVPAHMAQFLTWFNATSPAAAVVPDPAPVAMDGLARAAIAHLWFESIHPFEDGNGRIGRAIGDMAMAQHLGRSARLYSLSRQLLAQRTAYYDALNAAQRGPLDVTPWVGWFARQCTLACEASIRVMDQAMEKRRYWERPTSAGVNERQRKVLQRLLDDGDGGFLGGLTADKYVKMTGASKATATRDLSDLLAKGLIWHTGVGKGTRYYIAVPGWTHGLPAQE